MGTGTLLSHENIRRKFPALLLIGHRPLFPGIIIIAALHALFPVYGSAQGQTPADAKADWVKAAYKRAEIAGPDKSVETLSGYLAVMFHTADADANGVVDRSDQTLQTQRDNAKRRSTYFYDFHFFDLNGDWVLTDQEVRSAVSYDVRAKQGLSAPVDPTAFQAEMEKRMARVREELEVDSLESLALSDFNRLVLGKWPADPTIIAEDVGTLPLAWQLLDSNGDQAVTANEFFGPLSAALNEADSDGDGVIAADEIE